MSALLTGRAVRDMIESGDATTRDIEDAIDAANEATEARVAELVATLTTVRIMARHSVHWDIEAFVTAALADPAPVAAPTEPRAWRPGDVVRYAKQGPEPFHVTLVRPIDNGAAWEVDTGLGGIGRLPTADIILVTPATEPAKETP